MTTRRDFLRDSLRSAGALALLSSGACGLADLVSPKARVGSIQPIARGPFKGVFETNDPGASVPTKATDAANVVFPDLATGGAAVERPGFVGLTGSYSGGTSEGQGCFEHKRLDGTIDRLFFADNHLYVWAGDDTLPVLVATPAGVTLTTSFRVYCESYNGQVIINDEVNKPWVYDPAAGTGTVINVDSTPSAWNAKGAPVIYGGKVFFIVKTIAGVAQQNRIVWCEELTPTIGYMQTGFQNQWQLTQSGSDLLGGLAAEEAGLVYFRTNGIGLITGTVNSNFKANATRDSISTTVGTNAPAAIVRVGQVVWFCDLDGRVHRYTINGGEPEELWRQMAVTVTAKMADASCRLNVAERACGAYYDYGGQKLVLFTLWDRQTIYAFDAATGTYCGTWNVGAAYSTGITIGSLRSMTDSSGRAQFVIQGTRTTPLVNGVLWRHKRPDEASPWADQSDVAVAGDIGQQDFSVLSPWLTGGPGTEIRIVDVDAEVLADTAARSAYLVFTVPTGGVLFSVATTPIASAALTRVTVKYVPNVACQGAALRLRFAATGARTGDGSPPQTAYRWGLHNFRATAQLVKAPPSGQL